MLLDAGSTLMCVGTNQQTVCAFVSEDAKRTNAFLMHVINVVYVACLSGLLLLSAVWTPGREKALGCYLF